MIIRSLLIILFTHFILCHSVSADPLTMIIPEIPYIIPESESQEVPMEVDLVISLNDTGNSDAIDMDMPQTFAVIYHTPDNTENLSERKDLLGDLEEINFHDKKAWNVNAALDKKGLYQFIVEGKPFWNDAKQIFNLQNAKVIIPAGEYEKNWNTPAGLDFEIIPLSRPFAFTRPYIFNGRVMLDNKPLPDTPVYMGQLPVNIKKSGFSSLHNIMEAKTDINGQFSFILNQPGWWFCEAIKSSEPLKGADGDMKPTERSTILWLHVDNTEKK